MTRENRFGDMQGKMIKIQYCARQRLLLFLGAETQV